MPRILEKAGIPARYQQCSLAGFQADGANRAVAEQLIRAKRLSESYIERFVREDGGFREKGLLYIGPPGVGKTHLATAVLIELISRYRVRGLFRDFTSLLHDIQSTFGRDVTETKHDLLEPVMGAELLVLDELGAQKPTPWVNETLYLILNARYTRRLPTLFTTNYRLEAAGGQGVESLDGPSKPMSAPLLSARVSPSLLSRLYEMAQPVLIEASDFRHEVAMHSHQI